MYKLLLYYYYYYYYIRLTAFFQDSLGKPAPEKSTTIPVKPIWIYWSEYFVSAFIIQFFFVSRELPYMNEM